MLTRQVGARDLRTAASPTAHAKDGRSKGAEVKAMRSDPEVEMNCMDVQAQLSDLLDVRRGEQPAPEASPLGDPTLLAQVEKHLMSCENCNAMLLELEEIGVAFSAFSVGEKPTQDFAAYATVVRERMRQDGANAFLEVEQKTTSPSAHASWWALLTASAAAAILVTVLFLPPSNTNRSTQNVADAKNNLAPAPKTKNPLVSDDPLDKNLSFVATQPKPLWEVKEPQDSQFELPSLSNPALLGELNLPKHAEFSLAANQPSGVQSLIKVNPNDDGQTAAIRKIDRLVRDQGELILVEKELVGLKATIIRQSTDSAKLPEGLHVADVLQNSPAERAGLRRGDFITALTLPDGRALDSFKASSSSEAIVFFNLIKLLGKDRPIVIEYQRPEGSSLLLKSGRTTLGGWR